MPSAKGAKEMIGCLTAAASDHIPTLSAYVDMLSPEEARDCLKTFSRYVVRVMIAAGQSPLDVVNDAAMYVEHTEEWESRWEDLMTCTHSQEEHAHEQRLEDGVWQVYCGGCGEHLGQAP